MQKLGWWQVSLLLQLVGFILMVDGRESVLPGQRWSPAFLVEPGAHRPRRWKRQCPGDGDETLPKRLMLHDLCTSPGIDSRLHRQGIGK